MDTEDFVKRVLYLAPGRSVEGKKRLQKLAFFCQQAGMISNAHFYLYDFGPFSADVARAVDMLVFSGEISEEDRLISNVGRYVKVFTLDDCIFPDSDDDKFHDLMNELSHYSTLELEIASTIFYFEQRGETHEEAIGSTKNLKPGKSKPRVVAEADKLLSVYRAFL